MKASLVIPTYNKLGRLKLVIESIKQQSVSNDDFEVIFVDDGSSDGTNEYMNMTNLLFPYQYIVQQNKGRANARNTGIQNSKNEIIIFTDDDLILDKNFIKNHIKHHEEKEQIVHGKIFNLPFTKFFKDPIKGVFLDNLTIRPKVRESLMAERIHPNMLSNDEDFNKYIAKRGKVTALEGLIKQVLDEFNGKIDWISFVGGNVSISKKILDEVNGFDEKFGLKWGCEDVELGYRLMKKSISFCYAEDAANYHIAHYRTDFSNDHAVNLKYFYEKYNDVAIQHFHEFISETITKEEFINRILLVRL